MYIVPGNPQLQYIMVEKHLFLKISDVTCQNQTNVSIFYLPEIKF